MFRNQLMQRAVAAFVLTTFVSLSMYPLTAAAQAKDAVEKAGLLPRQKDEGFVENTKRYINKLAGNKSAGTQATSDDRFAALLNDIHEDLKAVVPQTALSKEARLYAAGGGTDGQMDPSEKSSGKAGGKDTRAIGPNMRIETERSAAAALKPLPGTDIAARVKSIKAKTSELKGLYSEIDQSFKSTEQHLKDARLPQAILDRHHQAVAQYESRKAEFDRLMGKVEQAAPGSDQQTALADLGSFMAKYPNAKPHQYTDPNKLPFRTPSGKVREPNLTKEQYQASLFPPKYDKIMLAGTIPDGLKLAQVTLPQTPAPADTAETEDVQLTPAIRAKAAELNNNPVQIYNWVRNNIAFIPSYGSIQGSDMTLMNKRGNAFDTASLLIALYRAAGIPARYVYGTIEVPADKVMNWVGGVTKPQAAQSLLGQGGIPNVGLVSGGTVKAIRMEHVWVEAYVDYIPSRGAANKNPDTWVPLDASYKRFEYTNPLDVNKIQGFDAQGLIDDIQRTAQMGTSYVQNMDSSKIVNAYRTHLSQIDSHFLGSGVSPSIEDLLGKPKIVAENPSVFYGSLPYRVLVTGSKFSSLDAKVRHYAKIALFNSEFERAMEAPALSYQISLPALNSRRLGISYKPASPQDLKVIEDAKKQSAGSLPAYTINVISTIEVDGKAVATGPTVRMGSPQLYSVALVDPQGLYSAPDDFKRIAGDEIVVGINGGGVEEETIRARNTEFLNQDTAAENLFQAALGYWLLHDTFDFKSSQQHKVVSHRLPSVGLFASGLSVSYFFGIARSGVYKGRSMDVPRVLSSAEGNSTLALKNYLFQSGMQGSFFEGLTFDQLFSHGVGQSISAVQLIKTSSDQGQKIYVLNQDSAGTLLPLLAISADAKQDISNAVMAGKHVIVPEREITLNRYSGLGYIIKDPETGAAAYLIDGGLNGGTECEKEPATETAKEPVWQKIGKGLLYTALLLLAIAIIIAVLGPVLIAIGATVAAAAADAIAVVGAGAALMISFIALPASAANEPRPPLQRKPDGTLFPPGQCTPSQYAALSAAQETACAPVAGATCRGLSPSDISCGDLDARIKAFNGCIAARQTIIFQCFESGDAGHWQQIATLQSGLGYCQSLYNQKQCDDCQD